MPYTKTELESGTVEFYDKFINNYHCLNKNMNGTSALIELPKNI